MNIKAELDDAKRQLVQAFDTSLEAWVETLSDVLATTRDELTAVIEAREAKAKALKHL